jgi:methionine aminopeptidase
LEAVQRGENAMSPVMSQREAAATLARTNLNDGQRKAATLIATSRDRFIGVLGRPGTGLELQEGMTFTIEPMVNAGRHHTRLKPDGWTVETKDGRLSAQWEHTVLVTEHGHEILTLRSDESIR